MTQTAINPRLTGLLGFNAGYVDTVGFLALSGLFTAHVTGNFVTFGAALVYGTAGALAKLSALPVFCAMVFLARLASVRLQRRGDRPIRMLIVLKVALLLAVAVVAVGWGPFTGQMPVVEYGVGMMMVMAMALQNALQRIHLGSAPPATLMTGNTTQVMIDLADLARGVTGQDQVAALGRLSRMVPAIVAFAGGCGAAAWAYMAAPQWCFAVPPVVAALTAVVPVEQGTRDRSPS